MSNKRVSEMTDDEIRALVAPACEGHETYHGPYTRPGRSYCVGPCTAIDMNARYADAEQCECGALIEEIAIDACLGRSVTAWVHVKRTQIAYDHAAVPSSLEGALTGKVRMVEALADRYALDGGDVRKRDVAHSIRTLLAGLEKQCRP